VSIEVLPPLTLMLAAMPASWTPAHGRSGARSQRFLRRGCCPVVGRTTRSVHERGGDGRCPRTISVAASEGIERGFDGGFHWFGVLPLLVFVVLIGVIVWAVIRLTSGGGVGPALARAGGTGQAAMTGIPAPARPDAAVEELRLRYARGEMSREDYAERLADLGGGAVASEPATAPSDPAPPDGT
jgi:putative membrane protein